MRNSKSVRWTRCFAFSFSLILLLSSVASHAQINSLNNNTVTPIPGAGHDYIRLLNETVNPANGSVNVTIEAPIPKGRGITLPFAISYNSNSVHHLEPVGYPLFGQAVQRTNTGYLSQGGWSYSVPMVSLTWSASSYQKTPSGGNNPSSYQCETWDNYMFEGHSLGIGSQFSNGEGNCPMSSYSRRVGGDGQVVGLLPVGQTDAYYNPSASSPWPATVLKSDGTVYKFPNLTNPHTVPGNSTFFYLPTLIEDRNGNQVTIVDGDNGIFSIKDTAGRTVVSSNGFGPSGAVNTLSFSGANYQVGWKTVSASFSMESKWVGDPAGPDPRYNQCEPPPGANDSQTTISQIALPNSQAYTFYYGDDNPDPALRNPYGLLSEIVYPDGGWVKYTWKPSDTFNELAVYPAGVADGNPVPNGCVYQYKTAVLASRQVGTGPSSPPVLTQTYQYVTNWALPDPNWSADKHQWNSKITIVTTTDSATVPSKSWKTVYTYSSVPAPLPLFSYVTIPGQIPVEQTVKYYGSTSDASLLRCSKKTWRSLYDLATEKTSADVSDNPCIDDGQSSQTVSPYESQTVYTYESYLGGLYPFTRLIQKDEYDFGSSSPSRTTKFAFGPLITTPIGGVLVSTPSSVTVTDGTNPFAETDYYYDEVANTPVSAVQHDDVNFPESVGGRGNLTREIKKCFGCTDAVTTYTYDKTGQLVSMVDPNGNAAGANASNHTTTYNYGDSYTTQNVPAGNTNAYLKQVTYPVTNGVPHTESFTYDYWTGQLASSKDQNSQLTTYLYNDPLARLTQTDFPDGGKVKVDYADTVGSPSVTTTTKVTSSLNIVNKAVMDGMRRTVQTRLETDPEGPTWADIQYDGSGTVWKKFNPRRSATSSTDGVTTFEYDALGRTTKVVQPDGSIVSTVYSFEISPDGVNRWSCTTVTDEAKRQRKSCFNAFGLLRQVLEPDAQATGTQPNLTQQTNYFYNILGNLTCVEQHGTAGGTGCASDPAGDATSAWRVRRFVYDSLSRLTTATNPESGTIAYTYDPNGNLIKKVDARSQFISYCYDALNRLTGKKYSSAIDCASQSSLDVAYTYDVANGFPPDSTYPVGRRTGMRDATGWTAWKFDPMGRILTERRTITTGQGNIQKDISYQFNYDGSTSQITYPSGRVIEYQPSGSGKPRSVKQISTTP